MLNGLQLEKKSSTTSENTLDDLIDEGGDELPSIFF